MGKENELKPIVEKLVDVVKKLQEEMSLMKGKVEKYSDVYCEGIKEGIAWSEKHK